MANPFTMFFGGNQPLPDDNEVTSLQKIACILYGGIGTPPSPNDNEYTLQNKIAAYLFAAQSNALSSGSGIATNGGTSTDSYRIANGQIQLYNPVTGLWYPLSVTGPAGQEQIVIGQGTT